MTFSRYVAVGDSLTVGTGDPVPGGALRGFADRLAAHLSSHDPGVRYANLARTSMRAEEVRRLQVRPAVAMAADLVTVMAGVNDIIRLRFDPRGVGDALDGLFGSLRGGLPQATLVTATLPDLSRISAVTRMARRRVAAVNDATVSAAGRHGVEVLRLDRLPIESRDLASDRIHPSSRGHAVIAEQLAQLLGLPPLALPEDAPRAGLDRASIVQTLRAAPAFLARRFDREDRILSQPPRHGGLVPASSLLGAATSAPDDHPRRRIVSEPA